MSDTDALRSLGLPAEVERLAKGALVVELAFGRPATFILPLHVLPGVDKIGARKVIHSRDVKTAMVAVIP